MFYLRYLRAELTRRKRRTILTLIGLAVGLIAALLIDAFGPSLDASSTTGGGGLFGLARLRGRPRAPSR